MSKSKSLERNRKIKKQMQVRIPIGFDPIVNLNFKLEKQNSKKSNQSTYVSNFVKVLIIASTFIAIGFFQPNRVLDM